MWRKSARSSGAGSNANYVEIALNGSAAHVRDSKKRTNSVIAVPDWAASINAIKHGDYENV